MPTWAPDVNKDFDHNFGRPLCRYVPKSHFSRHKVLIRVNCILQYRILMFFAPVGEINTLLYGYPAIPEKRTRSVSWRNAVQQSELQYSLVIKHTETLDEKTLSNDCLENTQQRNRLKKNKYCKSKAHSNTCSQNAY